MSARPIQERRFERILWDKDTRVIGIEWNESTSNMTDEDFKREQKAGAILVDV